VPELLGAQMWLNIFITDWGWLYLAADKYGPTSFFGLFANSLDTSPSLWLIAFLLPAVWYGFPFMMLAASAGLKLVPQDVFDGRSGSMADLPLRDAAAFDASPDSRPDRPGYLRLQPVLSFPDVLFSGCHTGDAFLQRFQPKCWIQQLARWTICHIGGDQHHYRHTVIILMVFVMLFNRWSRAGEGVTYA
jgi:hypothetical protein